MRHYSSTDCKRVALFMGHDIGFCRRVLSGILRFATEHGGWQFRDAPPDVELLPALSHWKPDGVIVHLYDRHLAGALSRFDFPIVSTTDTLAHSPFPVVDADNLEVGRQAARYFLRRGFSSFAYYGSGTAGFSRDRQKGFTEVLQEAGHPVKVLHAEFLPKPEPAMMWSPMLNTRLDQWLTKLPKPVALFCSNDIPARRISEACQRTGFRVPGEVAILGVDNDTSECRLSSPTLSSLDLPAERIGYTAARLLSDRMNGESIPDQFTRLPPLHIVSRESTDQLATNHPVIRKALKAIEDRTSEKIQVEDIATAAGVSRRKLERLFRLELRRSIHNVIQDSKIENAKNHLINTSERISEIAEKIGVSDSKRFSEMFKRATGKTPREFRKEAVLDGD